METSTATGAGRSAPAKNAPVEATGKSATRASVSSSFHSSYPTTPEGYEILDELGHGDNSAVYRAVCPPMDHESVAIKIVNLEGLPLSLDALVKEIRVMSLSSHDNVVPYSTSFVVGHHLWIVMPFISGTPMGRILRTLYPQGLGDESVIRYILHEALKGLNYFHRNKQIHRNLKADNIHLTTDGRVLLTDYTFLGLMLESGVSRRLRQTFVGTPCWMAPEVMEQVSGYDYKADVWSLGITALELAQGQAPYERYAPMKILQLTLQGPSPTLERPARFSSDFKALIDACLRREPAQRPTTDELLRHPFFRSVRRIDQCVVDDMLRRMPPPERLQVSERELHKLMHGGRASATAPSGREVPSPDGMEWARAERPPGAWSRVSSTSPPPPPPSSSSFPSSRMGVSGWNFADSPELAEAKRERDEARAAAAASTRTSAAVAAVVESSASSSAATDADAPVRAGRFLVLNPDPMEPAAGDAQQEVLSSLENANLIVVPSPRVIPPLVADTAPSPSGANTPATSTEVALSAEAPAEDKEVTAEGRPPSTLSVSVPPPPPLGRTSAPPPSSTKMASAGDADGLKRVSRGRFEVVDIPVESTTPGGSRRGFLSDAAGQVLPTAASMQSISSDGNTPLSSGVSLAALDGIVVRSSAVRSPLRPPQPPVRPRSPRSGSAQPNRGVDQATGAAAAAAAAAVATGATVPRHLQGAFAASRPLTTTSPSAVPEAGVHTAPAATTLHYSRQARSQNFPLAHASEEDLLVVMHHVAGLQRTLAALLPSDWNDGPSGSRTGPSPHASRLSGAESWYGAVPMSGAEPSSSNWSPRGDPPNNHHQHSAHASGATVVASTTTSPDQRSEEVGQLRQEMSMMRAENDQLRAELEALRTDLSGIKQQLVHWAASAAQAVPSQTRSRSADPAPVVPRSPGTSLHRSPPPPPPPPPR